MILIEGRDAPLYHFTTLQKLMSIITTDTLGHAEGTSLTRDVNTPYFSHGFWDHVALVLDQTKLAANHAIQPRGGSANADDFTLFQKSGKPKHASKEQEEFIAKPITSLHRYLTYIVISDSKYINDLIRFMKLAMADKPMPKTWLKYSEFVKRQGHHPERNNEVLNVDNWRTLFNYVKTHDIQLIKRPLRMTFATKIGDRTNLWHRDLMKPSTGR
jgi:hypothetical protein